MGLKSNGTPINMAGLAHINCTSSVSISGDTATIEIAASGAAAAWPIGSVFISVVSTNPATLLGFGTWVAFGAGKMLIGQDTGDTDFDTLEEIGGAKQRVIETLLTNGVLPQYTVVKMWKRTA